MNIDWQLKAEENGFSDPKAMFENLYYKVGHTIESLAEKLNVSVITIRLQLTKHDIPRHHQPKYKVKARDLKNLTYKEIEAKYKMSRSTAWRIKRRAADSGGS